MTPAQLASSWRSRSTAISWSFRASLALGSAAMCAISSARSRCRWRSAVLARWNQPESIGLRLRLPLQVMAAICVRMAAIVVVDLGDPGAHLRGAGDGSRASRRP